MKTRADESREREALKQLEREASEREPQREQVEVEHVDHIGEDEGNDFEDVTQNESSSEEEELGHGIAYEMLGFRSIEPGVRPPILQLSAKSMSRVSWASRDCTQASSNMSRIRPHRPLEAAFFDRLEMIRRVAMCEVAKATSVMEAVAILGVTLDREQILLGAEEILGRVGAKSRVLSTNPGNYEDLVAELATMRRTRIVGRKKEGGLMFNKLKV